MSKKKDPKVIRPADLGITKKQAIDLIKLLENKAPANAEKLKKSLFPAGIANYNKGGNVMPMHGKKKSKMMQRGGAAKKTKMMKKGGATMKKKTKYMAKGGMKKTKYMARGGAARR